MTTNEIVDSPDSRIFRLSFLWAQRLELELVFLDRCHEPALDVDLTAMRRVLVANDGIVIEASEDRLHVVRVTRIDIFLNDRGQIHLIRGRKDSAIGTGQRIFITMRTISMIFIALLLFIHCAGAEEAIRVRDANVEKVRLHYLTAGKGPAVLLLHGYAETSRMWRPLIPSLAEKLTVIAPDLPGIGDSSIPADRIDMISAAERIHALVRSLGIEKARVVGHDIGLMVAYAYAATFPDETEKLVLMDAFLPGVRGWEAIYNAPNIWHFRFNGEYPEKLVEGRERIYFEYFWNVFAADKDHSIPEADRKAYTEAYSKPGRMRTAWAYFASWPELAKDFAQLSQTKLTMPVLSIGGEKSLGNQLGEQAKPVANNAVVIVLPNTGHWILEEKPKETTDALVKFLQ